MPPPGLWKLNFFDTLIHENQRKGIELKMSELTRVKFTEEQQTIKECVEAYWTKRADGFYDLREAELHSNKYARWEKEILEQLPEKNCLNVLDVGCGCGFFGIILSRRGHQVTGIDLTPSMIERGRKLVQEQDCQVNLQVMDAEKLDFEDESFDVVISRNLTWTLPHPLVAYAEWKRVLKKGGTILNYDAEYAKNHHHKDLTKENGHEGLSRELNEECHRIYHMLTISSLSRPAWDVAVLEELGMQVDEVDDLVSYRIYHEKDRFYNTDTLFRIKALKK